MLIITIILICMWLIPGIICLYNADFSDDVHNGLIGVFTILWVTFVILVIGPFLIRMVLDNRKSKSSQK